MPVQVQREGGVLRFDKGGEAIGWIEGVGRMLRGGRQNSNGAAISMLGSRRIPSILLLLRGQFDRSVQRIRERNTRKTR